MKNFIEVHVGNETYAINTALIECFTNKAIYMMDEPEHPWYVMETYEEIKRKIKSAKE